MSRLSNRARALKLAAVAALAAVSLTGCNFSVYSLPLPGGADVGSNPVTVHVKFRDVLDLVPQSTVKVDDVTVGKVTDIQLEGYTADVTVQMRRDVKLPDNAIAEIRQTSLLGEKFVSLSPPPSNPSPNTLGDGDVIGLDRSGRNPEVEEVLGALSLVLNGGGVAQLKTISTELNKIFEGREGTIRSVLEQLRIFMGTLDRNKTDIVSAIESLNRLAISINKQRGTIENTLDEMPAALASVNSQRQGLVRMLQALDRLSGVGTRVIKASKADTIASFRSLEPVLRKLNEAGDAFPKSLQVALTYPFVDEVVGRNPAQARNLHMGDYTNLSVQMDIDLTGDNGGGPGPGPGPDPGEILTPVEKCIQSGDPNSDECKALTLKQFCKAFPKNPACDALPGGGDGLPGLPPLPGLTGNTALFRAAVNGEWPGRSGSDARPTRLGYDTTLGGLLIQGMVQR